MTPKEPVLLTVVVEMAKLNWHVAGITLGGDVIPLLRSDDGDFASYIGKSLDEQVSFLRHRFSGVLQRGSDRLWGRQKKACQLVFVLDGQFPQAPEELTRRLADHLVEWLANPPVVFVISQGPLVSGCDSQLDDFAGDILPDHRRALTAGLPQLIATLREPAVWELASKPKTF